MSAQNPAGAYAEAARLNAAGSLSIPVERTFGLEEAGEAQRASEAGHVRGRFVVVVG